MKWSFSLNSLWTKNLLLSKDDPSFVKVYEMEKHLQIMMLKSQTIACLTFFLEIFSFISFACKIIICLFVHSFTPFYLEKPIFSLTQLILKFHINQIGHYAYLIDIPNIVWNMLMAMKILLEIEQHIMLGELKLPDMEHNNLVRVYRDT